MVKIHATSAVKWHVNYSYSAPGREIPHAAAFSCSINSVFGRWEEKNQNRNIIKLFLPCRNKTQTHTNGTMLTITIFKWTQLIFHAGWNGNFFREKKVHEFCIFENLNENNCKHQRVCLSARRKMRKVRSASRCFRHKTFFPSPTVAIMSMKMKLIYHAFHSRPGNRKSYRILLFYNFADLFVVFPLVGEGCKRKPIVQSQTYWFMFFFIVN